MRNKNEKQAESRKRLVLSILAVLVLVLLVIGVTYGVYSYTDEGVQENVIRTGNILFTHSENTNGIMITDALPISDAEGKVIPATGRNITQGYFDFSLTATIITPADIKYEIYGIDTSPSDSKLKPEYVKVYLTNAENETAIDGYDESSLPTFSSLPTASDGVNKKLSEGVFSESGTRKYRLRIWVSDNYPILEKNGNKETFSMKVNVTATA